MQARALMTGKRLVLAVALLVALVAAFGCTLTHAPTAHAGIDCVTSTSYVYISRSFWSANDGSGNADALLYAKRDNISGDYCGKVYVHFDVSEGGSWCNQPYGAHIDVDSTRVYNAGGSLSGCGAAIGWNSPVESAALGHVVGFIAGAAHDGGPWAFWTAQ